MVNKIIEFCSRNRFFTFLFTGMAILGSLYAIRNIPLDAIPDLSDVQVIIFTEWPGRSPDILEDQVTYPIVSAMIAAPKVKVVRGYSFFGLSFVYTIFEDGTDIYWARSRTLELLSKIRGNLPEGVNPALGPDATGVGWVFEYALVDETGQNSLAELRSFQDWYLRYWLQSVPGVAEVASLGGFTKQYQVEIDPNRLLAYNIPLHEVIEAIQSSNNDVGGRVLEMTGTEYMIRGRGYIRSLKDIEEIAVLSDIRGNPIRVKDLAHVQFGSDMRRGAAELNGMGEVVGGVVVMRFGENAYDVIERVKTKLKEVEPSFPKGVKLVTTYDRSGLIERSIHTLQKKLLEEMLVVALVILLFLWHFRSSLVPILSLPIAVLLSFIPMYYLGVTSNIMSLGGIAIAIGAMVDAAIILVENAHKRLEEWKEHGEKEPLFDVLLHACQEVGRPIFFSLLVIAVSFMPIFALTGQEGRLFKPLAFTKNFSIFFAALLAITLAPALIQILLRPGKERELRPRWLSKIYNFVVAGKIHKEENHPVSKSLFRIYAPILNWILENRKTVIVIMALMILTIFPLYSRLGSEFMPPLNEGDLLYMPTTLPGISVEEAKKWLQIQDKLIKTFPEVNTVFGKIGQARTATDPAPFEMVETVVQLQPMRQWPKIDHERWYSSWMPDRLKFPFRWIWPEQKRRSWEELVQALNQTLQLPGTSNAWVMPIKTRIDMLTTGIRTPVGIKIFGPDLATIQKIGEHIEGVLPQVEGTRSVFSERVTGGYYLDFKLRRESIARYGLTIGDAEEIIETAIGGMEIATTIEGRERYTVNVRYPRELRSDLNQLRRVLVPLPSGAQIPIGEIADLEITMGPPSLRDENGMLTGWVFIDIFEDRDIGGYVEEAKALISSEVELSAGYYLSWSGQFEYMERAKQRLLVVVPVTLLLIALLLYMNTGSGIKTGIVLLAVPFSLIGAFGILWILGYNVSVAVWVGIIALAGVDAETGVVMLLYLDLAYEQWVKKGKMQNWEDLKEAIHHGAVQRLRPKLMTVGALFMGLLPIMWAPIHESGADMMKRIAAPMVGGILTSFIGELLVYPAIFAIWKGRTLKRNVP
ncbi:MAG: efflux RND transporter permease subunit [Deltaproteobacteria bacterium]|nr:efflux RND transporter permease subunit [Deltaproteobacteria bacterium]